MCSPLSAGVLFARTTLWFRIKRVRPLPPASFSRQSDGTSSGRRPSQLSVPIRVLTVSTPLDAAYALNASLSA
eukprot:scaffold47808_cov70-Phaeocystis_antarctica.AAC.8